MRLGHQFEPGNMNLFRAVVEQAEDAIIFADRDEGAAGIAHFRTLWIGAFNRRVAKPSTQGLTGCQCARSFQPANARPAPVPVP